MIIALGLILFLIFLALAGLHIYWFFGGSWMAQEAIPTNINGEAMLKPSALSFFMVIFGLLFFGFLALQKTSLVQVYLPDWLSKYGIKALGLIFLFRTIGDFNYVGLFKKITETTFGQYDNRYYIPLCALISLLSFFLDRYATK